MFCKKCGKQIEKKNKFCPYCGSRQDIKNTIHKNPDFSYGMDVIKQVIFILLAVLILIWFIAALKGWKPNLKIFTSLKFRYQVWASVVYILPLSGIITLCMVGMNSIRRGRYHISIGGIIIIVCAFIEFGYKKFRGYGGAVSSIPHRVCQTYSGVTKITIIISLIITALFLYENVSVEDVRKKVCKFKSKKFSKKQMISGVVIIAVLIGTIGMVKSAMTGDSVDSDRNWTPILDGELNFYSMPTVERNFLTENPFLESTSNKRREILCTSKFRHSANGYGVDTKELKDIDDELMIVNSKYKINGKSRRVKVGLKQKNSSINLYLESKDCSLQLRCGNNSDTYGHCYLWKYNGKTYLVIKEQWYESFFMGMVNGENTIGYGLYDDNYRMYQSITVYDFEEEKDEAFIYCYYSPAGVCTYKEEIIGSGEYLFCQNTDSYTFGTGYESKFTTEEEALNYITEHLEKFGLQSNIGRGNYVEGEVKELCSWQFIRQVRTYNVEDDLEDVELNAELTILRN